MLAVVAVNQCAACESLNFWVIFWRAWILEKKKPPESYTQSLILEHTLRKGYFGMFDWILEKFNRRHKKKSENFVNNISSSSLATIFCEHNPTTIIAAHCHALCIDETLIISRAARATHVDSSPLTSNVFWVTRQTIEFICTCPEVIQLYKLWFFQL